MTNWEVGRKFIQEAERILKRDAVGAYEEGSWNLSIRRSQEAVELALKGLLRMLGIDYPKHHDVGELFLQQVMDKFPAIKRTCWSESRIYPKDLAGTEPLLSISRGCILKMTLGKP